MEFGELFTNALTAHQGGDLKKAQSIYEKLLAFDPNHASSWVNLGLVYQSLGNSDRALKALKKAEELAPDNAGVHYNLGNLFRNKEAFEPAVSAYQNAIKADPNFADAHNNLGEVLMRQDNLQSAINQFKVGLQKKPRHINLLVNLGNAYYKAGNTQEALKQLTKAKKIAPSSAIVYRNLGNILRTSGSPKDAEQILKKAIELAPDDPNSRVLMAFCKFYSGQFGDGWDAYAWRWQSDEHEPLRGFSAPFWRGESLNGKTLLIWGEQAVGDELMFASIYPDFANSNAHILIETEFRLDPLFKRSFPNYKVFSRHNPPCKELRTTKFDYQIAAGDLGRYRRRSILDFPESGGFLKADHKQVKSLRERYFSLANGRRIVGLSWRSSNEQTGTSRSVPLESMRQLLRKPGILFINLQYGDTRIDLDKIASLGADIFNDNLINPLRDMDAAAAQVASLDFVITSANTTAHVSGALGIPTSVILSKNPDWRWGADGCRTPWYSSLSLHRQKSCDDWRHPLEEISAIL